MGAQAALEVASMGIDDLVLVDIVPGLAEGEALDISHKLSEAGVDVSVTGSSEFSSMAGADVVVITAGLARKPGMTRMDLLGKNAGIVASVAKEVGKHAPDAVAITVTNPMDVMNYVVQKTTAFPVNRVVGMGGVLDLSRFKHVLSLKLGVSRSSIMALVIGEHGENMVPLARYTSIGGVPLTSILDAGEIEETIRSTRQAAIDVIAKKGANSRRPRKRDRPDGEGGRPRQARGAACFFLPRRKVRRGWSLHRRSSDAGSEGRGGGLRAGSRRRGEGTVHEGRRDDQRRDRLAPSALT